MVLTFPTTSESEASLIEFELRAISVGASLVAAAASATPSAFAKEISPAVLPTVALAAAATCAFKTCVVASMLCVAELDRSVSVISCILAFTSPVALTVSLMVAANSVVLMDVSVRASVSTLASIFNLISAN